MAQTKPSLREVIISIIEVDRLMATAIREAVIVLRGPDEDLREEAIEILLNFADSSDDSCARLSEFV